MPAAGAMAAFLFVVFAPMISRGVEVHRGTLHFLGISYDEAPPRGKDVDHYDYAPDNFAEVFRAQSSGLFRAVEVKTLKGNSATRDAVLRELRSLDKRVGTWDFVFVYWGTHGGTRQREWSANLPGGEPILGSEIKNALGRLPCQVAVAISTCGSGGFICPAPGEFELPANVTAFAACQRRQTTNNELDVSLLEAMAGFGDSDGDGIVTLREVVAYVPRRYRKLMRNQDDADTIPVLGQGGEVNLGKPVTRVTGRHAAVAHEGTWYGAVILQRGDGEAKVRYLGWDPVTTDGGFSFPDETVPFERIDFAGDDPPLEVEWSGTWYPAVVRERKGPGRLLVHYVGYPDSDDEIVGPKRLRYPFSEAGP